MNGIFTLLRLELRQNLGFGKSVTKKAAIAFLVNALFSAVIYAVYLAGVYFITDILIKGAVPLKYEFLVISTGISVIVQTIVCTGKLVKNLYYDGDNELLLRFPVDGAQIFIAKSIFVFIYNALIAFVLMLPVYAIYGAAAGENYAFYLTAVPVIVLTSILPFCLSNLIALPVINLTNLIKNRFALLLALMIIIVIAGFSGYMIVLGGVLEYAQNKSAALLSPEFLLKIRETAGGIFPFNLYANVLYGEKILYSLGMILLLSVVLGAGAYIAARKSVYPIVLKSIERESEAFEKKTPDLVRPVFAALLRKEYLMIFRSLTYSFQYLAMALTAPVMVFFCNRLASSIGDKGVGGRIIPGLTLLVVIIFVTIIVSFASTAVSREGNTFYLTKIMPVSYAYQIAVKLVLYLIVASASVILSLTVVGAAFGGEAYGNNVKFGDLAAIFAIAELLIVALTALAIRSDIKYPSFETSKSGDLSEAGKNVSTNILFGCVFAVLYGLAVMIFSYVPLRISGVTVIGGKGSAYLFLILFSAIFALYELLRLFRRLNKRYNSIKE
jgi:hypothetical protein